MDSWTWIDREILKHLTRRTRESDATACERIAFNGLCTKLGLVLAEPAQ